MNSDTAAAQNNHLWRHEQWYKRHGRPAAAQNSHLEGMGSMSNGHCILLDSSDDNVCAMSAVIVANSSTSSSSSSNSGYLPELQRVSQGDQPSIASCWAGA